MEPPNKKLFVGGKSFTGIEIGMIIQAREDGKSLNNIVNTIERGKYVVYSLFSKSRVPNADELFNGTAGILKTDSNEYKQIAPQLPPN